MAKFHFTFDVHLPGTTPVEETVTVTGADMQKARVILENRYPHASLISFKRADQEAYERAYVDQVAPATPAAAPAPQRAAAGGNGGGGVIAGGALLIILALGAFMPGGETTAPVVVEEERIEEVRPIVAVPQGFEPIAPVGEPQPEPFFTDGIQEEAIDDLGQDWDN